MKQKSQSVCVAIFSKDKSQILLTKRRDLPVWVLPGGGIEPTESPREAAVREVYEETHLHICVERKIAIYRPTIFLTKLTHFFEGEVISGELQTSDETSDLKFFPIDSLPYFLPPPYPNWISDALHFSSSVLDKPIQSVTYFNVLRYLLRHPILVARFFLLKLKYLILGA